MVSVPLAGLKVLVTRPQHQAAEWREALHEQGASTQAVPLLAIQPVSERAELQAIKNCILDLDLYQTAIFVSQNAANYGCDWIDQYWPQLPVGVQWLAVGKKTAEFLWREGYDVSSAEGEMNSEALLRLPCLQSVRGQRVLIFRGQGGRPHLAEVLTERGAKVDHCELYERLLPIEASAQLAALRWSDQEPLIISVHSGESFKNLCESMPKTDTTKWLELPLLLPGERVAELAQESGFKKIIVAENATSESMLAALIQWRCSDAVSHD
jgi:uroporphyrinogen-III synthase